jgi:aspartate carbamoyltransferase catalytic subunit
MTFKHKDLLGLKNLHKNEIELIIDQAKSLKEVISRSNKQVPTLRGKTFLNLFCEPSTRTKASFDMAIKLMGAGALNISVSSSSFTKGESLFDTVKNLEAMGIDGLIIRHNSGGAPHFIAKHLKVPVINAGDGFNEHPTQALLDIFTMLQKTSTLKNKNVLILGDIAHSRVARSNIWALTKLGAKVFVCGPATLIPRDIEKTGVTVVHNLIESLPMMDFINVLRIQFERQDIGYFPTIREYRNLFGLTPDKLPYINPKTIILHPGPINRGSEIDSALADGQHNVILEQVTNGVAIRMAILYILSMKEPKSS